MFVIAHISDMHVDAGERSAERTARVVRHLAGMATPPDVVIATGDLADHGTEDEYERVRSIVELPVPVVYCPGNHDVRGPLRKSLLLGDVNDEPVDQAYEINGVLILMADSSIPGRHDGRLGDDTIAWLDSRLTAAPGMPTFVCFHHPPVPLGTTRVDALRQFDVERLEELVLRHPQIVALLCGHAHTAAATTFAGKPLLAAPGIVSTTMLPMETDTVVALDQPPMIAFHLLDDDLRLTTHYRVIV